jgi:signal transduction histidine kinase
MTLFSASIIAEVLPRLWEKNPDEARRRLEEVRQLTRGALAEMRTSCWSCAQPPLVEAVGWLSAAAVGRERRRPLAHRGQGNGRRPVRPAC